jgi:hypothetical protein
MSDAFCYWRIATKENPTDCAAHLAEGRVWACPYKTTAEAAKRCADYEPPR